MHQVLRASVVIPTFRDWDALLICVRALERQTLPREQFEVIVVDNDPAGARPAALPDWIRYLNHPQGFSYAARNAGIRQANGLVIAFTDADCIPAADWLENAVKAMDSQPEPHLVAGAVTVDSANRTLLADYDRTFGIPQERFSKSGVAATANLVVPRKVFEKAGLFDEQLESGGDVEFCRRAKGHGFSLRYAPAVGVWHPVRGSFRELRGKNARMARGLVQLHYRRAAGKPVHTNILYALSLFKPRLGHWRSILTGHIASQVSPARRTGLVMLRLFFQYDLAVRQLALMLKSGSHQI